MPHVFGEARLGLWMEQHDVCYQGTELTKSFFVLTPNLAHLPVTSFVCLGLLCLGIFAQVIARDNQMGLFHDRFNCEIRPI